jgi:hypothetical protein
MHGWQPQRDLHREKGGSTTTTPRQAEARADDDLSDLSPLAIEMPQGLSRVLSIVQQMRRGCGVSFHQQRT